ncbi:urease subunit beta [Thalassobellus citreus]|uniref:urease subunit beta n=1 Tax=Thalassobellus citreus TaxID=3367752 RepID=UPI00379A1BB3
MIPGEFILKSDSIRINIHKKSVTITVSNTGDRPIQIGSHFHFFEVNKKMDFDRMKTLGMRLNIASGTAVRFEPGEGKEIELVTISGDQIIFGFNNLIDSNINAFNKESIRKKLDQFLKQ